MSKGISLTDEQRRRIETAKSAEEKARILIEATEGAELSDDQLDAVSGGVYPKTHEEIDAIMDLLQAVFDKNPDVAAIMAFDMGLIPYPGSGGNGSYFKGNKSIDRVRVHLHNELNGISDPLVD